MLVITAIILAVCLKMAWINYNKMYVEVAIGTPQSRGVLVARQLLGKLIKKYPKQAIYRSTYLYPDIAKKEIEENGTVKKYFGKRSIDNIIIDIDKGNNTDDYTWEKAQGVYFELESLGVFGQNIKPFFSGSGYHLLLPASVFEFDESDSLPFIVKNTMEQLLDDIDSSIYMRTGLYRMAHTLNTKTNLYKIPLEYEEFLLKGPTVIHKLAESPRFDFPYEPIEGTGELKTYVKTTVPEVQSFTDVSEPRKVVPCIQQMYNLGPLEGSRHSTILRLTSHFKRHGIPSQACKAALLHWNQNSLEQNEVSEKVESIYNYGYRYGCNDDIMKKHCQPQCIYYKRKDYLVGVKQAHDLQKDLRARLKTNYVGKSINLAKSFGLPNKDVVLYPGDLVTIFGPTGCNKTALAQCLALGYDFKSDRIVREWQIPTLFLSLELSGWYMHRRNLQIVAGMEKDTVNGNIESIWNEYSDLISHMSIQTISPTIDQIKEKIRELQPALVVVDYIDLVETGKRGEYEQVKFVSHQLSNLAVNEDMLIIQISQVSRDYSRNEILDLYAGKGSGAIENASRKVIGVNGNAQSSLRNVKLFKNTDGDLFDVDLEWTPSFRLRRIDG